MYFFEWMAWWGSTLNEEEKAKTFGKAFMEERERDTRETIAKLHEQHPPLDQPASDHPRSRGPVYAFNDTFLEMRCGSLEHYRGLLTALALIVFYATSIFPIWGISGVITGAIPSKTFLGSLLGIGVFSALIIGFWYCFFKFKFYIPIRWELFTHRRLLIRFNRKTRQVYLHRPKYAGGVVAMPWEKTLAFIDDANSPLMVAWHPYQTGLPFVVLALVGKRTGNTKDLADEWEFIRRYMEVGPESVPKPRVRSKIPWPWYSLEPQFEGLWPILRHGDWKLWLGKLLMSPAFLILGMGHWVSQLLCWEPRWPKIIREAGQPGKPIPKLTTAEDYDPETCRRLYLNADLWVPEGHDPSTPAEKEKSGSQWLP